MGLYLLQIVDSLEVWIACRDREGFFVLLLTGDHVRRRLRSQNNRIHPR